LARFKVYFKILDQLGEYVEDFIDVSEDLLALGDIQQGIDNTEFDVGMIKASSFTIKVRNDEGKYSYADVPTSIFQNRIKDTVVRVTWNPRDKDLIAGYFTAGQEILGGEVDVFEGLINTINVNSNVKEQSVTFTVLGYESMLNENVIVFPGFPDIFSVSQVLYDNFTHADSRIAKYATAYPETIEPSFDFMPDAGDMFTNYENKTVGESISNWLLGANSVLFIKKETFEPGGKDHTIYVVPRDATTDLKFTFRGYGSLNGPENILDIPKYSDGTNRIFNFWVWDELAASSDTSRLNWGTRKKDMNVPLMSASERQDALDTNLAEFQEPKIELDIEVPLWYDTVALNILDKVAIDFPPVTIPADDNPLPRYGFALYDDAVYPYLVRTISISDESRFKILQKRINPGKQTILFKLREA
jgi:hypothetical protein